MPGSTRYVQVEAIIEEFGFSRRQWLNQAAAGRVPGARQPFGPGTTWVFDIEAVRAWWAASERKPDRIRPQNDWRPEPRYKGPPATATQRNRGGPSRDDENRATGEEALQKVVSRLRAELREKMRRDREAAFERARIR